MLSTNTLSALHEFYAEKDQREKKYEDLKIATERPDENLSMDMFAENWNASQFWVSTEFCFFGDELILLV